MTGAEGYKWERGGGGGVQESGFSLVLVINSYKLILVFSKSSTTLMTIFRLVAGIASHGIWGLRVLGTESFCNKDD